MLPTQAQARGFNSFSPPIAVASLACSYPPRDGLVQWLLPGEPRGSTGSAAGTAGTSVGCH